MVVMGHQGIAEGMQKSPGLSLEVLQVVTVNKKQWPSAIQSTAPWSFL